MNANAHGPFVVGIDGSDCAIAALDAAVELGAPTAAPIVAVFVRHHPGTLAASTVATAAHHLALESVTNDIEAELLTRLADYPGQWRFDAREGDPEHQLIEAAEQHGARMVIVGHRGHNPVTERFAGSVAAGLVHHCPISVLVAR